MEDGKCKCTGCMQLVVPPFAILTQTPSFAATRFRNHFVFFTDSTRSIVIAGAWSLIEPMPQEYGVLEARPAQRHRHVRETHPEERRIQSHRTHRRREKKMQRIHLHLTRKRESNRNKSHKSPRDMSVEANHRCENPPDCSDWTSLLAISVLLPWKRLHKEDKLPDLVVMKKAL